MTRGRKPSVKTYDSDAVHVQLIRMDKGADAIKRTRDAQNIILKMMSMAREKGRPRKEKIEYGKVA